MNSCTQYHKRHRSLTVVTTLWKTRIKNTSKSLTLLKTVNQEYICIYIYLNKIIKLLSKNWYMFLL